MISREEAKVLVEYIDAMIKADEPIEDMIDYTLDFLNNTIKTGDE